MTNNTMISVSTINTTLPTFVDDRLNKATQRIISIYTDAAKYADNKNRELAKIFSDVAEKKAYEKDGFKSVADYANTIFGIKRQNAYALASAGKIYNSPDAPDELKAMSPSKLAEISSLNRDKVVKAITDGTINKDTTQKDLREFASKIRENEKENKSETNEEVKNRKESVYMVKVCAECFEYLEAGRNVETEATWDAYFNEYFQKQIGKSWDKKLEIIPIAPVRNEEGKIIKRRKVYITQFDSFVVEFTRVDDSRNNEPSDSTDNT